MLEQAGISRTVSVDTGGGCVLMGYCGNNPEGILCLDTQVDAALLRWLFVRDTMRGRGLAAALVDAARSAARTRGARILYAIAPNTGDYLTRFGFEHVTPAEIAARFGRSASEFECVRYECSSYSLDISRDGLIDR
jgi:GNAT superfamily N-acetyltransferase